MPEPTKNKPVSFLQKMLQLIWLLILLLFPALIIGHVLSGYQRQLIEVERNRQNSEAAIELARLDREMNLTSVVNAALLDFTERCQILQKESANSREFINLADRFFFDQFPKSSQLLWFNRSFKIIDSTSSKNIFNRTAWEKFLLVISAPRRAKKVDRMIAESFIKTEMSDFLSSDFFEKIRTIPVEIIFQSKRVILRQLEIPRGNSTTLPRYLLAILPTESAKKDWLEKRALKKMGNSRLLTGALRFSSQTAIEGSTIPENLLVGFSEKFQQGIQSHEFAGIRYYFSVHFRNPDLFLCVGLPFNEYSFLNIVLQFLKAIVFLPFVAALFWLSSRNKGFVPADFSLRSRFKLATIGLTSAPIILMTVAGALYLVQQGREMEKNRFNRLDAAINSFSDSISQQTSQLENYLRNQLNAEFKESDQLPAMAKKAFELLKKSGCELTMALGKKGEIFHETNLKESLARNRLSFFIGMIKMPLITEGFAVSEIEKKISSALGEKYSKYRERKFRYDFYNRLNSIELGNKTANLFTTFVRDRHGNILACLGAGFDSEIMRQFFLKNQLRNFNDSDIKVFLHPQDVKGTFFHPNSAKVAEIIELSALTGKQFEHRFKWQGHEYQLLARLLDNSKTAAAAVTRVDSDNRESTLFFLAVFTLILISAGMNSKFVLNMFENIFLEPVLLLNDSVKSIRDGKYGLSFEKPGKDEIGTLKTSFNKMAAGLKEKSEMKKYLNQDLYSEPALHQEAAFSRKKMTMMFCGIRNFTALEKALPAEEAFRVMNLFLSICDKSVRDCSGTIDKFIGETAMAGFKDKKQFKNAIEAALQIKSQVQNRASEFPDSFTFGIGIAGGELITGPIGSKNNRLDFTAIGDPVNLAARLEKLAGREGKPQILVVDQARIADSFVCRKFAPIKVKGKTQPVEVLEIVGMIE